MPLTEVTNNEFDSDDEDREAQKNKNDPLYPLKHWRLTRKVREAGKNCLKTRELDSFRYKYSRYYVKSGPLALPAGGVVAKSISELQGTYTRAVTYEKDEVVDSYVVLEGVESTKSSFRSKFINNRNALMSVRFTRNLKF
jgi:hypothetical protein